MVPEQGLPSSTTCTTMLKHIGQNFSQSPKFIILTRNQTSISFSLNDEINHSSIVNNLKTYETIAPKNKETI